jgi:hypothetical protein
MAVGTHQIKRAAQSASVVGLGILCACSSSPSEPQIEYVYTQPEVTGDGWSSASLTDADIDLAPITEAMEGIRRGDYPRVHGIVVARRGRLTGLAIEHGFIGGEDAPVYIFFPEYEELFDPLERQITVRHLLTMTSGWAWSENTEWGVSSNDMYGFNVASDPLVYLFNQEMDADPGTRWVYNGGAVTLLGKVVEKASGLDLETFSERYLFTPMGVTDFTWPYMRPDLIAAHGDARLRPRDMAKLGQMFLDGGLWAGERLLSEAWVDRATAGALGGDYGYLWWGDGYRDGQRAYRSYSARGWGGQRITVFPELDMVVVLTGGNYETWEPVDAIIEQHILPAVGF